MLNTYIERRYGSKRGLLRLIRHQWRWMTGRYRRLGRVDFDRVERLVFICSGNICRSAFGEWYARSRGLEADSYGLHTRGGDPADPRAIDFAARQGIDMSGHVTKNFDGYTPRPNDLILVMEPDQAREICQRMNLDGCPSKPQMGILPLFNRPPVAYLHDPFCANADFFDLCETRVMQAVDRIGERLAG